MMQPLKVMSQTKYHHEKNVYDLFLCEKSKVQGNVYSIMELYIFRVYVGGW